MANELKAKRHAWDIIFNDPNLSINSLGHRAMLGNVCQQGLRSVCWKIFLGYLPSLEVSSWPEIQREQRQYYTDLKKKYIESPAELMKSESQEDVTDNNPLALNESNPWQQFFIDFETRKVIRQDVDRTFPDVEYFRLEEVQQRMTDILFIYCKIHHGVSYRQGMHELLAPLYWALAKDSFVLSDNDKDASALLDPTTKVMAHVLDGAYIEHDAYLLFDKLMQYAKPWYEVTEELPSKASSKSKPTRMNPVVMTCHRIHHEYLRTIDPPLYNHLESLDIEPQLFGIRWLRLLFGREFDMNDLLRLWDAIFAQDPTLKIAEYISLALLLRMRDGLMSHGYAESLGLLMRPSHFSHPASLVEQAKYLQDYLTEDAALHILRQNDVRLGKEPRTSLWEGVQAASSESPPRMHPNRLVHRRSQGSNLDGLSNLTRGVMKSPHVRDINKAIAGVMGTVQKNVNILGDNMLGRASTDSPYSPYSRQSNVSSEFPAGIDRLASTGSFHKYSGTFASGSEDKQQNDREASSPKSTYQQMAELMTQCIGVIERELFSPNAKEEEEEEEEEKEEGAEEETSAFTSSEEKQKQKQEEKKEKVVSHQDKEEEDTAHKTPEAQRKTPHKPDEVALTVALAGLKHVRDVLSGRQIQFDPSPLNSLTEHTREWRWDLVERDEALEDKPRPKGPFATASVSQPLPLSLQTQAQPLPSQSQPQSHRLQTRSLPALYRSMPDIKSLPPVHYIPANPAPPKQEVVYSIEDLLSDPALQPTTPRTAQNTKFRWMLHGEEQVSPKEESLFLSLSSDLIKAPLGSTMTDSGHESNRVRTSTTVLGRSTETMGGTNTTGHPINTSNTSNPSNSGGHTMDPLDAKNVDKRKAYEYMF